MSAIFKASSDSDKWKTFSVKKVVAMQSNLICNTVKCKATDYQWLILVGLKEITIISWKKWIHINLTWISLAIYFVNPQDTLIPLKYTMICISIYLDLKHTLALITETHNPT